MVDTNPVMTQHVLVATVKDKNGKGVGCQRVEWLVDRTGVGEIIEVGGKCDKVDNSYAISKTVCCPTTIKRGNEPDLKLKKGQAYCVITSPVEGMTNIIAYAPQLRDWGKHKVFARKYWSDLKWEFPGNATNLMGTPHELVAKVVRASTGAGVEGAEATFKIVSGPAAVLAPGDQQSVTVKTDANGVARATLKQVKPMGGQNVVEISGVAKGMSNACYQGGLAIPSAGTGTMTKTWVCPEIKVQKAGPVSAMVGDELQYQITVTNTGPTDATNVVLVDPVPTDALQTTTTSPNAKPNGQGMEWSLGAMKAGESRTVTLNAKALKTGNIQNTAVVRADNCEDRSSANTNIVTPSITLEKSGPTEVLICDPICYTVTVRNTGDCAVQNVQVTDQLPEGLKTQSGNTSVLVNVGTLAPKEAKRATYNAIASRTGTFNNTAVASADRCPKVEASWKVIVRQPALAVTKTGPSKVLRDRNIDYNITIKNTGDGAARDLIATDTLPAGTRFVSASNGGRSTGNTVVWNLGTLEAGQSTSVQLTVQACAEGNLRNVVVAKAVCGEASAECVTAVTGVPGVLLTLVDNPDPIEIGQCVTYEIVVLNQGMIPITNIKLSAIVPNQETYTNADGPTAASVSGKTVTFATIAQLAPQQRVTYHVMANGASAGDARFTVSLMADQLDSPVVKIESTHVYESAPVAAPPAPPAR